MPESNDTQRFDALLDAMLTKPPLDDGADQRADESELGDGESE